MDIKEDEQQPFDEPSVLYDEVLGGLEDEVVILKAEEDDDDSWLDNAEVLHGTILDDPHQNIGEKEPIATHSVPDNYQEPPLLLYQSGRAVRTRARRTYTQLARGNFTSILSNTDEDPSNPKLKEVVDPERKEVGIPLKLKRWR
jgi:hypothetical protein